MCVCAIYIYIHTHTIPALSGITQLLGILIQAIQSCTFEYTYKYVYIYVCVCVCVYIYIYIPTQYLL